MGGLIDMESARALVADSALWPKVRDFLWDFAPQIDPSWLDAMAVRETTPRAKAWLLSSLGVSPCFHSFPKEDWSRLLLLDGAMLESIAKWLGALVCAESLRRVTDGAAVRGLKAVLPGVYPDVFAYTAYFRGVAAKEAKSAEDVVAAGMEALSGRLSAQKPELLRRFQLKMPKDLCGLCVPCGEKAISAEVLSKLLKLKFPEAYRLCC